MFNVATRSPTDPLPVAIAAGWGTLSEEEMAELLGASPGHPCARPGCWPRPVEAATQPGRLAAPGGCSTWSPTCSHGLPIETSDCAISSPE